VVMWVTFAQLTELAPLPLPELPHAAASIAVLATATMAASVLLLRTYLSDLSELGVRTPGS
jgi:hypothetical protein